MNRYGIVFSLLLVLASNTALADWCQDYRRAKRAIKKGECAKAETLLRKAYKTRSKPGVNLICPSGLLEPMDVYCPHLYLAHALVCQEKNRSEVLSLFGQIKSQESAFFSPEETLLHTQLLQKVQPSPEPTPAPTMAPAGPEPTPSLTPAPLRPQPERTSSPTPASPAPRPTPEATPLGEPAPSLPSGPVSRLPTEAPRIYGVWPRSETSNRLNIKWASVRNASSYEIETDPYINVGRVHSTATTIPLQEPGKIRLRLRGLSSSHEPGPWSRWVVAERRCSLTPVQGAELMRAKTLCEEFEFSKAKTILQDILRACPTQPEGNFWLGMCCSFEYLLYPGEKGDDHAESLLETIVMHFKKAHQSDPNIEWDRELFGPNFVALYNRSIGNVAR